MYKKWFECVVSVLLVLSITACGSLPEAAAIVVSESSTIGAGQVAYGLSQIYNMAPGTCILQDLSGTYYSLSWAHNSYYYFASFDAVTGAISGYKVNAEGATAIINSFLHSGYVRMMADNPELPPALVTLLSTWGTVAKELVSVAMSLPVNVLVLASPAMINPELLVPTQVVIDT